MKKTLLLVLSVIGMNSYAQNDYEIISIGNKYSIQQIEEAFEAADLCGFYFVSENRFLLFDDGSEVHLKNQSQLPSIDADCFIQKNKSMDNEYWEISENGHLIRRIQNLGK